MDARRVGPVIVIVVGFAMILSAFVATARSAVSVGAVAPSSSTIPVTLGVVVPTTTSIVPPGVVPPPSTAPTSTTILFGLPPLPSSTTVLGPGTTVAHRPPSGSLAFTGSPSLGLLVAGAGLVVAGGALLVVGRRSRRGPA